MFIQPLARIFPLVAILALGAVGCASETDDFADDGADGEEVALTAEALSASKEIPDGHWVGTVNATPNQLTSLELARQGELVFTRIRNVDCTAKQCTPKLERGIAEFRYNKTLKTPVLVFMTDNGTILDRYQYTLVKTNHGLDIKFHRGALTFQMWQK